MSSITPGHAQNPAPVPGIKRQQFDDNGDRIHVAEAPEPAYLLRRRIVLAEEQLPGLQSHLRPIQQQSIARLKQELAARLAGEAVW